MIRSNRSVACWGRNDSGQLGDGSTMPPPSSTTIIDTGLQNADKIYAESEATCAILLDGTASCWGANASGWLGVMPIGDVTSPTPIPGLTGVAQLAMRPTTFTREGMCARLVDGTVACWGSNTHGQVGDGTVISRTAPVVVGGLDRVIDLAAGLDHTCAARDDGTVACWGFDGTGQLGDGHAVLPRPVTAHLSCP